MNTTVSVSVAALGGYELEEVRQALAAVLAPLGGMARFVQPGMQVLLKPNLLLAASPEHAVTTHPMVVQAVAEMVQAAGGLVQVGDSPSGPVEKNAPVWRKSGLADVAARVGATIVTFQEATWHRVEGCDYFIARPVGEADLVINLPKLKTHVLTSYSGAIKNLYGTVPGTRKREIHMRAPGVQDFSRQLAAILSLVRPGLTILDGVLGLEGNGPGMSGRVRAYGCLMASADPVALDSIATHAMGYAPGAVLHLTEAGQRGLGVTDRSRIEVVGDAAALAFGRVALPVSRWIYRAPAWASAPIYRATRVRPELETAACIGCGRCVEACPAEAITAGKPARIDPARCVGCMCCAEVCPEAAIHPMGLSLARLLGLK